jgi:hypothetical protein
VTKLTRRGRCARPGPEGRPGRRASWISQRRRTAGLLTSAANGGGVVPGADQSRCARSAASHRARARARSSTLAGHVALPPLCLCAARASSYVAAGSEACSIDQHSSSIACAPGGSIRARVLGAGQGLASLRARPPRPAARELRSGRTSGCRLAGEESGGRRRRVRRCWAEIPWAMGAHAHVREPIELARERTDGVR